jgi:signal transduction histidine kinase
LHKSVSIWEIYGNPGALVHRLQYQISVEVKMALTKRQLIGELKHEINSPLAAIRNALFLAATRTDDPEIQRYLQLADHEAARISQVLKNANQIDENKRIHIIEPHSDAASAA